MSRPVSKPHSSPPGPSGPIKTGRITRVRKAKSTGIPLQNTYSRIHDGVDLDSITYQSKSSAKSCRPWICSTG